MSDLFLQPECSRIFHGSVPQGVSFDYGGDMLALRFEQSIMINRLAVSHQVSLFPFFNLLILFIYIYLFCFIYVIIFFKLFIVFSLM
jgi:hypothetical protein